MLNQEAFFLHVSIIHLVSNVRIQQMESRRKESLQQKTAIQQSTKLEAEVISVRGRGMLTSHLESAQSLTITLVQFVT